MKTWEWYFYKQILKNAALFLLVFYGLYVLIDYASHLSGANYHHSRMKIHEFFLHYGSEFSDRADILIPFALLISTIHTLCGLNINRELIALLAGGYSLKRLLIPFIMVGLFGCLVLYLNNEVFLPNALKTISHLDQKYAKKKIKSLGNITAESIKLENGGLLIYKNFDTQLKQFYEVFYLPSLNEIWKIAILEPFTSPPKGHLTDQFKTVNGILTYQTSETETLFPSLHFDEEKLSETFAAPREWPLSKLYHEAPHQQSASINEKAAKSLTALYQKIAMPWLALIAVIGPAPFCLRFSRHLPVFFIFAVGIFGLVGIYLVMDASILLAERQVIEPFTAIFLPMGSFLAVFLYRFIRIST